MMWTSSWRYEGHSLVQGASVKITPSCKLARSFNVQKNRYFKVLKFWPWLTGFCSLWWAKPPKSVSAFMEDNMKVLLTAPVLEERWRKRVKEIRRLESLVQSYDVGHWLKIFKVYNLFILHIIEQIIKCFISIRALKQLNIFHNELFFLFDFNTDQSISWQLGSSLNNHQGKTKFIISVFVSHQSEAKHWHQSKLKWKIPTLVKMYYKSNNHDHDTM